MHPRRNDRLVQVDLFEASSGEPVCSGALMIYPLERYDVGLVQLKEREVMIAVPAHGGTCKILALPDYSFESWDEICLPKNLAMKMAPGGDFDSDYEHDEHCGPYYAGAHQFPFETAPTWVCDVDVADAFIVLTVSFNHAEHSSVVVYDFLMKTWKIVLGRLSGDKDAQAPFSWDRILERSYHHGIRYLEPRPRLRLGMTDYPQSRQGHVAANVTMSVIPNEVTEVPQLYLLEVHAVNEATTILDG